MENKIDMCCAYWYFVSAWWHHLDCILQSNEDLDGEYQDYVYIKWEYQSIWLNLKHY